MNEEEKHKLSQILYYSDIHPADTEFINNKIYDLIEENKILKEKLELIQNNISDLIAKVDVLKNIYHKN